MDIFGNSPHWIGREGTDLAWRKQREDESVSDAQIQQGAARIALAQQEMELRQKSQAVDLTAKGFANQAAELGLKQKQDSFNEIHDFTQSAPTSPDEFGVAVQNWEPKTPGGMEFKTKALSSHYQTVAGLADQQDKIDFNKSWSQLNEAGRTAILAAADANSLRDLYDEQGNLKWVARQEMAAQQKAASESAQKFEIAKRTAGPLATADAKSKNGFGGNSALVAVDKYAAGLEDEAQSARELGDEEQAKSLETRASDLRKKALSPSPYADREIAKLTIGDLKRRRAKMESELVDIQSKKDVTPEQKADTVRTIGAFMRQIDEEMQSIKTPDSAKPSASQPAAKTSAEKAAFANRLSQEHPDWTRAQILSEVNK